MAPWGGGRQSPLHPSYRLDPAPGKAIPYGVYDLTQNTRWVSVGVDHDTPAFAVESIARWWRYTGKKTYPDARELFITADAGGSNSARARLWKVELQRFAARTGLTISVSRFPPGTSKWNKIGHRLFCHITENWRGRPLIDDEAVVQLTGSVPSAVEKGDGDCAVWAQLFFQVSTALQTRSTFTFLLSNNPKGWT